jgi:hypothetical protein
MIQINFVVVLAVVIRTLNRHRFPFVSISVHPWLNALVALAVFIRSGQTQRTNPYKPKKYSVDFQALTKVRKNIFRSPPSLLLAKSP